MAANGAHAVMVSTIAFGQGVTSVAAALERKLVRQGQLVRVFKTGPDFIDPMVLRPASGALVETLDLWTRILCSCRAAIRNCTGNSCRRPRAVLWQQSMRAAHQVQLPILAKCGGMMMPAESNTDTSGIT